MNQALMIISIFEQLIPMVRTTVESLEKAFPESGTGSTKLQLALTTIDAALGQVEGYDQVAHVVAPMLTPLVNTVVAGVNAVSAAKPTPAA